MTLVAAMIAAMFTGMTLSAGAEDVNASSECTISLGAPSENTVKKGDTVEIPVLLEGEGGISAAQFNLSADPEKAKITEVKMDESVTPNPKATISEDGGSATVSFYGSPDVQLTAAGTQVAVVTLQAESYGSAALRLEDTAVGSRAGRVTEEKIRLVTAEQTVGVNGYSYTVSLGSPSVETAGIGDSFTVPVLISGNAPLTAAQLDLSVDPSIAKIVSIEMNESVTANPDQTIEQDGGKARISFYGNPSVDVSSADVQVALVKMEAAAAGEAKVSLENTAVGKGEGLLSDIPLDLGTSEQKVTIAETDKTALNEAIQAASEDKDDTAVSKDGSDVAEDKDWVTEETAKALEEALEAAKAVAEDKNASQADVDSAAEALNEAKKAFDEAKQKGKNHEDYCPSKKYKDIDTSLWYHEALDYVLIREYFKGTSESTFEPDGTMTRAMFVTVLSRMEGIDQSQYTGSDFTDVKTGQWYSAAIQWASKNNIVNGIGGGLFNPDGNVTREQMAAIMYRYANYKKIDTAKADTEKYKSFTDKDKVSDWAVEAMTWATGVGIINGMGNNKLAPQESSTRAQVAQIVKNYDEKVAV